jgi:hypothetical protein
MPRRVRYASPEPLPTSITTPCVRWKGPHDHDGYGITWLEDRSRVVHRIIYEQARGPIPEGMQIDHLCRTRDCIRLDHLEAVTQAENLLRGNGACARNARKTECKRGHPLSGDNLVPNKYGKRWCRVCHRAHRRAYYRRKRDRLLGVKNGK